RVSHEHVREAHAPAGAGNTTDEPNGHHLVDRDKQLVLTESTHARKRLQLELPPERRRRCEDVATARRAALEAPRDRRPHTVWHRKALSVRGAGGDQAAELSDEQRVAVRALANLLEQSIAGPGAHRELEQARG